MATHSSVLAWRIPGTEEPSGLPSMGSHRVGHDWSDLASKFKQQTSSVCACIYVWVVVVQSLISYSTLSIPWTAAHRASLSFTISQSWFKLMSIESVMPSNHQSFPASGSFPMSRLFTSGGQCIGASTSASVLSMTIQGWFPSGLTGLISLQSKRLSRIFSNTTVGKHQFFNAQSFYGCVYMHMCMHICMFKGRDLSQVHTVPL